MGSIRRPRYKPGPITFHSCLNLGKGFTLCISASNSNSSLRCGEDWMKPHE